MTRQRFGATYIFILDGLHTTWVSFARPIYSQIFEADSRYKKQQEVLRNKFERCWSVLPNRCHMLQTKSQYWEDNFIVKVSGSLSHWVICMFACSSAAHLIMTGATTTAEGTNAPHHTASIWSCCECGAKTCIGVKIKMMMWFTTSVLFMSNMGSRSNN